MLILMNSIRTQFFHCSLGRGATEKSISSNSTVVSIGFITSVLIHKKILDVLDCLARSFEQLLKFLRKKLILELERSRTRFFLSLINDSLSFKIKMKRSLIFCLKCWQKHSTKQPICLKNAPHCT